MEFTVFTKVSVEKEIKLLEVVRVRLFYQYAGFGDVV